MPLDIEHLYRRYGSMVFRRCRQLLRDDGEAKDAMQDTFVNLVEARETLDNRFPFSLLHRMATHVCLNRIRTRQRHPEDRDEHLLFSIADGSDLEGSQAAGRFLGRLFSREGGREDDGKGGREYPRKEASTRVLAVLHFVDGLTLEEVAEECGLSVSGVRKRLRKIRATALRLKAEEEEVLP
jgi:DNA-directed RNA polymerase specialized sigma24 family protein